MYTYARIALHGISVCQPTRDQTRFLGGMITRTTFPSFSNTLNKASLALIPKGQLQHGQGPLHLIIFVFSGEGPRGSALGVEIFIPVERRILWVSGNRLLIYFFVVNLLNFSRSLNTICYNEFKCDRTEMVEHHYSAVGIPDCLWFSLSVSSG